MTREHPPRGRFGHGGSPVGGIHVLALALTLVSAFSAARASDRVGPAADPAMVGLDHIPLAVNDLASAAERYRQLGFTLKPGRTHANGIRNRHVKFADGTEIELITVSAATDALSTRYLDHLKSGDGPAFVSFFAPNLDHAATRLDAWHKPYRREQGLLTFLPGDLLRYVFLGPRNRSPTDRPEHFEHANRAVSLIGVWIATPDAGPEKALLSSLGITIATRIVHAPNPTRAEVAALPEGEVVFVPGERQRVPGRRVIGATIRTRDIAAVRGALAEARISIPATVRTEVGLSLFLPPEVTHGIWLEFREFIPD